MNKELTPLEAWKKVELYCENNASYEPLLDYLEVIETALKRIPDLEKALDSEINYGAMMNKQGLELKKKLEHSQEQRELYFKQSKELKANLNKACKQLNEYGRKLKVLDIVVNKHVEMGWLLFCFKNYSVYTYNSCQDEKNRLTLEEYDFIKEVIIHDR